MEYDPLKMITQLLDELNPEQREAVEHVDGPMLILAGPGSGKTRVIVYRTAYLIHNAGIPPENIIALTFTNKAANEMKDRISALTDQSSSQVTASTFHALCSRLLRSYGTAISIDRNFSIYDQQDQLRLIRECLKDIVGDTSRTKRISPNAVLSRISKLKTSFINPAEFKSSLETMFEEVVQRAYENYELQLHRQHALDFDDLLIKTLHLMHTSESTRDLLNSKFTYLMVDEFQDTDPIQYALAKVFSGIRENLVVVGDPDQSIYSWRNADITNILSFQEYYSTAKVVELKQNYRSTQNIVDSAQSLITNNSERFKTEMITAKAKGHPVVIKELINPNSEATFAIAEVAKLCASEGYSLNDMAIMYRTNAQSRVFEEAVMLQNIPYKLVGALPFFQRKEIKDLLAYLRVISNPRDDVSIQRIINVPPRGIGSKTIADLSGFSTESGLSLGEIIQQLDQIPTALEVFQGRLPRVQLFSQLMQDLRDFSAEHRISDLIEHLINKTQYLAHLSKDEENSRDRSENLQELLNLASSFDELTGADGLMQFLEHSSLVTTLDELNENDDGVTLITLHQAKGLEFGVVFLAGVEEDLLPHIRSIQEYEENGNSSAIEEERRLCYVGVTRAQERLYVTYCQQRPKPWSTDRYSSFIPDNLTSRSTVRPSRFIDEMGLSPFSYKAKEEPQVKNLDPEDSYQKSTEQGEVGEAVVHPHFGNGIILKKTTLPGNDAEFEIFFSGLNKTKRLLMNSANLVIESE